MALLFDKKFPTKQFMTRLLGISESDWINNQPARSLDSLQEGWAKLGSNEEIIIADAPIEFAQFAKIWKMNGYETGTSYSMGVTPKINVISSPILREKAEIIFGDDVDWTQERLRAIRALARVFNQPNLQEKQEGIIRAKSYEIPKWAIK
mgnify:CR=1 FL=1